VGVRQGPRAPPGQAVKLRIGDSSVSIERGDITDCEVDAIVNAANSTLAMGAGVAGAIKRKGGVIIEEEAMRQGPVEVGEATLAGLNIPYVVIHDPAMIETSVREAVLTIKGQRLPVGLFVPRHIARA